MSGEGSALPPQRNTGEKRNALIRLGEKTVRHCPRDPGRPNNAGSKRERGGRCFGTEGGGRRGEISAAFDPAVAATKKGEVLVTVRGKKGKGGGGAVYCNRRLPVLGGAGGGKREKWGSRSNVFKMGKGGGKRKRKGPDTCELASHSNAITTRERGGTGLDCEKKKGGGEREEEDFPLFLTHCCEPYTLGFDQRRTKKAIACPGDRKKRKEKGKAALSKKPPCVNDLKGGGGGVGGRGGWGEGEESTPRKKKKESIISQSYKRGYFSPHCKKKHGLIGKNIINS